MINAIGNELLIHQSGFLNCGGPFGVGKVDLVEAEFFAENDGKRV